MRHPVLRLAEVLLGSLLPRCCVLCGAALAGPESADYPLCPPCRALFDVRPLPRCSRCGLPLISERDLCADCRGGARAFDEAFPLYDYRGPAGRLISAYKFGARYSLAAFWAERAGEAIRGRWPEYSIVPVPPRPSILRERGWDHVELVARRLEGSGLRVERVLERGPSLEQKRLDLEGRRRNAAKAYRLAPGRVSPALALVLDDVLTSGATAEACARALKGGGAERVAFVAFAAD